jgi:hypothetical protein
MHIKELIDSVDGFFYSSSNNSLAVGALVPVSYIHYSRVHLIGNLSD